MGGGGPPPANGLGVTYPHSELNALRVGADEREVATSCSHPVADARSSMVELDTIAQLHVEQVMLEQRGTHSLGHYFDKGAEATMRRRRTGVGGQHLAGLPKYDVAPVAATATGGISLVPANGERYSFAGVGDDESALAELADELTPWRAPMTDDDRAHAAALGRPLEVSDDPELAEVATSHSVPRGGWGIGEHFEAFAIRA